VKGKPCLGITQADARRNLHNREYSAIAFVENVDGVKKDEGSGALQYYDWCERGKPQLWINDLCRVTELDKEQTKPSISPIDVLLVLFEELAHAHHIRRVHLMVDEDKRDVLGPLYERYGFANMQHCEVPEQIIMVKRVRGTTARNKGRNKARNTQTQRRTRRAKQN
jgi:hypothetical protein